MPKTDRGVTKLVEKRHISAHEVLKDVHSGMDDKALMQKYNLSIKDFNGLFQKLIESGLMKEVEFSELQLLWAQKDGRMWRCPACHMPQSHEFDECPQCGVIVSKIKEKTPPEQVASPAEEFVEVQTESPEEQVSAPEPQEPLPAQSAANSTCTACNMPLPAGAKYCTSCGARVQ
ncbi:MAG TPA: zinc-ribbon domain-containing protein [Desulfomonilaceae bacterium]|nr:zinc-ribbon domain-containing protein [Desulfomonilaceae bacterium]